MVKGSPEDRLAPVLWNVRTISPSWDLAAINHDAHRPSLPSNFQLYRITAASAMEQCGDSRTSNACSRCKSNKHYSVVLKTHPFHTIADQQRFKAYFQLENKQNSFCSFLVAPHKFFTKRIKVVWVFSVCCVYNVRRGLRYWATAFLVTLWTRWSYPWHQLKDVCCFNGALKVSSLGFRRDFYVFHISLKFLFHFSYTIHT